MDAGQKYTEEVVKEIEKRLNAEYAAAEKEIQEKLDDYFRRYEIKDKKWQEWVEDGKKTEEQYKAWKTQQLAVGDKWQAQRDMIARDLHNTNEIAKSITRSYMPQVYAENFNYATYDIEHGAKINTSFTLYSRESVERLVRDDPKLLPDPSKRTLKRIADAKDVVWNKQQLQSVMIQGILQGDSIPNLATRLAKTVGEKDRKAAVRNARTMATATQNAGRRDAYKRAQNKGVDVEQMWLATMDNRTRHSHRWLDREVRPLGEAFSNGCEYPADPKGDPAEVYNCRCSLRGVVKGLERRSGKFRDDSAVGGMSYDEWRDAKPKYNPILLPEEKGRAIKQSYINEYRGRGGKGNGTTPPTMPTAPQTPKAPTPPTDNNARTREALIQSYTYHQEHNNLTQTPMAQMIADGEKYVPIKVNYGKLSDEVTKHITDTITRLSKEYDTPLQTVHLMNYEDLVTGGKAVFARVSHNYSMDSADMAINPLKFSDYNKMTDRIKELREAGYIPKIKKGTEGDYITTHEFAHTLFDTQSPLEKNRNWAGVDQNRIKEIRKETEALYREYLSDLEKTEKKWKEAEGKALQTFDEKDAETARKLYEEYDKKKISKYSLTNSDEFMAEAFAQSKLGEDKSEYTERMMDIIDRHFKR